MQQIGKSSSVDTNAYNYGFTRQHMQQYWVKLCKNESNFNCSGTFNVKTGRLNQRDSSYTDRNHYEQLTCEFAVMHTHKAYHKYSTANSTQTKTLLSKLYKCTINVPCITLMNDTSDIDYSYTAWASEHVNRLTLLKWLQTYRQ